MFVHLYVKLPIYLSIYFIVVVVHSRVWCPKTETLCSSCSCACVVNLVCCLTDFKGVEHLNILLLLYFCCCCSESESGHRRGPQFFKLVDYFGVCFVSHLSILYHLVLEQELISFLRNQSWAC